jgi:hypothetical protein
MSILEQLLALFGQKCYIAIGSKYIKHVLPVQSVSPMGDNTFQAFQPGKLSAAYIIDFTLEDVDHIETRDSGYVEVHLK